MARFLDELRSEFEERVLRPLALLADYRAPESQDHPYWQWRRKATRRYARLMWQTLRGEVSPCTSPDVTPDEELYHLIQDCLNVFERESLMPLGVLEVVYDRSHPYWGSRRGFIHAAAERLHHLHSDGLTQRRTRRPADEKAWTGLSIAPLDGGQRHAREHAAYRLARGERARGRLEVPGVIRWAEM